MTNRCCEFMIPASFNPGHDVDVMSVNYVRRGPRPLVHCYRIGPVRTGRVTKSSRATASESSPTQWLQYPKQQFSIIRGEEHCVPEAGMQWHILSGTSRSQGNILNGVEWHPLFVRDKPQARFRHPSLATPAGDRPVSRTALNLEGPTKPRKVDKKTSMLNSFNLFFPAVVPSEREEHRGHQQITDGHIP